MLYRYASQYIKALSNHSEQLTPQDAFSSAPNDVASFGINDFAERDYFTLRERIAIVTQQVEYLQDYIKEQCLK
ncbi:lysis system i-spanin subunit Rz [Cronobacter dublinensis]